MAFIGVTELMSDPDFVDAMQVITRLPSINFLGENSLRESVLDTVGSIQPADFKTLQRLPEELRVADVSSFFFKGQIIATAPGKYSSILVFKGKRYQVQTVADYSNWGPGYTEGTCIAEVPS